MCRYGGTYNYFDPDNYMSTAAMLWSGDAFLQQQVKAVLERSGSFLNKTTGQLPHHFVGLRPIAKRIVHTRKRTDHGRVQRANAHRVRVGSPPDLQGEPQ